MSQPRTRAAAGRPVALVDAVNSALGLALADAAEARRWLADGGWQVFDAWISARRGDPDDSDATTEEKPL